MTKDTKSRGSCYCGHVTVEVQGTPMASGLCHCEDCQKFHAAPFMAWCVWPTGRVEIKSGEVNASEKSAHLKRVSCRKCGGNVVGVLPEVDMTVVFGWRSRQSCHVVKSKGIVFKGCFAPGPDTPLVASCDHRLAVSARSYINTLLL